jgi:hypothetical protein
VAQRVVHQVGHQPLDQPGVTGGRGGTEGRVDADGSAFCLVSAAEEDGIGDLGEIQWLPSSITNSPTWRAAIGSVIYLVLIALLALGVATAIRETAVSIGFVLGLLYLPPLLAASSGRSIREAASALQ